MISLKVCTCGWHSGLRRPSNRRRLFNCNESVFCNFGERSYSGLVRTSSKQNFFSFVRSIATGDPMCVFVLQKYIFDVGDLALNRDKAGGYGIQSLASSLISRVDGCFYNVMGLPAHGMFAFWNN